MPSKLRLKRYQLRRDKFKIRVPTILPAVFLFLLIVFFSASSSAFLKPQNIMNIMRQSSILLIVASGTTFVILQGSIDLSMGSIVTLAGISSALLIRDANFGIWAVPVAMLIGATAGVINGAIFAYGKVPSFLVTLGAMFVIEGISLIICKGQAVQIWDRNYVALASGTFFLSLPNIAIWAATIYVVSIILAMFTKFGRYMYAIGGGERAAKLSGVPVDEYKLYAFVFAGLLSGLAGALMTARLQSGSPQMGSGLLLDSIAAVVIGGTALTGGTGGPHRTIIGVLIMGILSNGLNVNAVDPYFQTIIKGTIVIVAVFLTIDRNKIGVMK